jgi:hypothetical protein
MLMRIKINKKSIFVSSALIFALVFFSFSNLAYASEITVSRVIELVNQARGQQGLNDLSENDTLSKIAQDKLEDMIKNNYFAHTSPKGVTPWSWYEKEGYDYKYAGENLAINFMTAENQQKAWMDSPTHKKNILNPLFQEVGVAVGAGEINNQMAIISVQEFGTLAGTGAVNKPSNFNGSGNKNILKQDTKISPTVLSVKDTNNQDYLNFGKENEVKNGSASNYFSDVKNSILKNKELIYDNFETLAMALFLVAVILMPMAFLIAALDSFIPLMGQERLKKYFVASKLDNKEENVDINTAGSRIS